jgi:hypothetical protein
MSIIVYNHLSTCNMPVIIMICQPALAATCTSPRPTTLTGEYPPSSASLQCKCPVLQQL